MLVLLVIFILSAPMFTSAVKLELPRAQAQAQPAPPAASVTLAIDAKGHIYGTTRRWPCLRWTPACWRPPRCSRSPSCSRADKDTRYEVVAQVMAAAQGRGLNKLSFVTDPNEQEKK